MYTDELEPLLAAEQEMRLRIALRLAQESGVVTGGTVSEDQLAAADFAIEAWLAEGEDEQDMAAFRPIGPLQQLLIDHAVICDRIVDIRDRRLS